MARTYWKDITGQRFNRLLVLGESEKRDHTGAMYWYCLCDCGNTLETTGVRLRNGTTQSCGCLGKELRRDSRKLPGDLASFNSKYAETKYSARQRGLEFSITKEEFRKITSKSCEYCGRAPEQYSKKYHIKGEPYYHNGLDRVDNSLGYTVDNVVSCCRQCNIAKNSYSQQEFFDWVKRVYSEITKRWLNG